eukprot:jgi/Astpho2/6452/Aster-08435
MSPWCDASSSGSAASTDKFKEDLIELYGLDMGRDQFQRRYVRCQVTWEVMVSGGTVAAHLFPKSYRPAEAAWNQRKVCLQHDSLGVLRFRVLSVDLWDKSPAELCEKVDKDGNRTPNKKGLHATEALRRMKFSELDGKEIFFPKGVTQRPYQRVVVAQAADAISTQYSIQKLRPDIEPFGLDVLSDFPQKREKYGNRPLQQLQCAAGYCAGLQNAVTDAWNIDLRSRLRTELQGVTWPVIL